MKEVSDMKTYDHDQNIATVKAVKAVKACVFDSGLHGIYSCIFCLGKCEARAAVASWLNISHRTTQCTKRTTKLVHRGSVEAKKQNENPIRNYFAPMGPRQSPDVETPGNHRQG